MSPGSCFVAGFGCRKGCSARDVIGALELAAQRVALQPLTVHALFAPEWKRDEPGLREAAALLHKPLSWLDEIGRAHV
jgi:cobalt-precorrin 5A hydrolase